MPDDTQQAIPAVPSPAAGDEPHEHHMYLLGRYYRQVEAGRKTIEVRVATPQRRAVAAGDTVVFQDRDTGRELDVIVQRVAPYASFEELLSSEDAARIDPDGPPGDLLANLRSIYPPAKEALGVLASTTRCTAACTSATSTTGRSSSARSTAREAGSSRAATWTPRARTRCRPPGARRSRRPASNSAWGRRGFF